MPNPLEILIAQKKFELVNYQTQSKKIVADLDGILTRFSAISSRSAVVKDEKRKLKLELGELNKEIETLSSNIVKSRSHIENKRLEIAHQRKFLDEIRNKTEIYQLKFNSVVTKDERRKEIDEIEMKIEKCLELKKWIKRNPEEASDIISGERLRQMREEFSRFKVHRALLEQKLDTIEQYTKGAVEQQQAVRQKIDVFKKRNAAQLTRLQKQIDETKKKNDAFRQMAFDLENDIFRLKAELNDIH